jgi:ribosomal protein S18 acetylase RimI-like enzyme
MEIKKILEHDNEVIVNFWREHLGTTIMVIRGNVIDSSKLNGFVMYENDKVIGLITYIIYDNNECEIMSLDSLKNNIGVGTKLIEKVKEIAIQNNCSKIKLITTNDNINAIKFYQKRGFIFSNIYVNALEFSRKLEPKIPLIGDNDIPIRDELEFEMKMK